MCVVMEFYGLWLTVILRFSEKLLPAESGGERFTAGVDHLHHSYLSIPKVNAKLS